MIIIQILLALVLINLLLLAFSCDSGETMHKFKKTKKKTEVNTPKVWSKKNSSNPIFADK